MHRLYPEALSPFLCLKEVTGRIETHFERDVMNNYLIKWWSKLLIPSWRLNRHISLHEVHRASPMSSSASACLSLLLTCPLYNPGRLFGRGIFSKPSPSSVEAPRQPALHHILARSRPALRWGLWKWKTSCCWDTVREAERGLSSLRPFSSRLEFIMFLSHSPFLSVCCSSQEGTTFFVLSQESNI